MFSVVKDGAPFLSTSLTHQFHEALPGWIQLVSATRLGGLRSYCRVDSTRRPGSSATSTTRHAECQGSVASTATSALSRRGESNAENQWPAQLPDGFVTYIDVLPSRSASTMSIHATPGSWINSGRPMRKW